MSSLPSNPSQSFVRRNPHLYGNSKVAPAPGKMLRQSSKPKLNKNHEDHPDSPLPNSILERDQTAALERSVSGETKSVRRVVVRFVGYRVKPLDPDNFAGSVKDLLDGLRHAGLISGDEPWRIVLETRQVRVSTFREQRTIIEIDDENPAC